MGVHRLHGVPPRYWREFANTPPLGKGRLACSLRFPRVSAHTSAGGGGFVLQLAVFLRGGAPLAPERPERGRAAPDRSPSRRRRCRRGSCGDGQAQRHGDSRRSGRALRGDAAAAAAAPRRRGPPPRRRGPPPRLHDPPRASTTPPPPPRPAPRRHGTPPRLHGPPPSRYGSPDAKPP